ncbi:hypothetical protein BMS3Bbin06_02107 [bacterium BMS3Bbin06]|nr:hypothetical protein BMS3Bbin06_02107 [bacterium BMS3Bbin06]HDO36433.1 prepilin-type N-terminal cleavage/methylation domain-containing protein [Nitrospirota bacterium]HDY71751.1 prepilin-type N-terminal cleavage/methylation domain-containing protein [Nitrospirota bacterium]
MNRRGFTLIEVLIATAIIVIILGALYSTFFLVERAASDMEGYGLRLQEARRVLDVLSGELKSTLFSAKVRSTRFVLKDRDFFGKPTSDIVFTTINTTTNTPYVVEYYVKEEGTGLILMKRISRGTAADEKPLEIDALKSIESFSILVKEGNKWIGNWDTDMTSGLPKEFKIGITFILKGRSVRLSRIVKPMIEI